ncbi:MAG: DUF58 domain-containing protein [Bacteroidia bacterium]
MMTNDKTTELLKKVRKIEIKTKGLSDQIFSGGYHSAFKGRGMSFSEVREYQWGDDVRNIDWNVTARTETPYIKIYEEERELTVMLLIDVSPSTVFGTQLNEGLYAKRKDEILTEICAVLSFSAINNNDKVGVIFFTNEIEKIIPPQKGKNHILLIIRELLDFQPRGKGTDVQLALQTIEKVLKKRSVVFFMSDFMHQAHNYKDALGIVKKRHDIMAIHLFDERERNLPENMLLLAEDSETEETLWIDTSDLNVRKKYTQHFDNNLQLHQTIFQKVGADFLSINIKNSYIMALLQLFKARAKH